MHVSLYLVIKFLTKVLDNGSTNRQLTHLSETHGTIVHGRTV